MTFPQDAIQQATGLIQDSTAASIESRSSIDWLSPEVLTKIATILFVLALARLAIYLVDRATRFFEQQYSARHDLDADKQRARTISHLFSSVVRYIAWPLAVVVILDEIGIDVGALIATAGIAGLAVGFGAQTLVKDVIGGIFLLFDDSISVGDTIRHGEHTGVIEDIGVRLIRIRKYNGELMMIPSGELRVFSNLSRDFARAIVEISVDTDQNLESVLSVIQDAVNSWAADNSATLLDDKPEVVAMTQLSGAGFDVRIVARVRPGDQFQVERGMRAAIKKSFDATNIRIAVPRSVVLSSSLSDASS